ncbi:uncharacterized protein LOC119068598 [Bradysia coprophila]|uniref:uncharacterized protein LOC119068598 n=1 Tax=Bradysia coprophila TaxID=38358 RepID=UPI00187D882F|nr:uncharacterized protein LOC119068598 [Bradysia coprophila]
MGKNKKANTVPETEPTKVDHQYSVSPAAKVDYSIPVHSRQAAFSLLYLFLYSVMMFTLPFGAFFGVRHVLADRFNIVGFPNTCYSVLSAVIVVNFIIVLYAYKGYHETEYDSDGNAIVEETSKAGQPKKKQELNKKTE